jgi:RNA polymerase sigma-70 factor, ECF subfamily
MSAAVITDLSPRRQSEDVDGAHPSTSLDEAPADAPVLPTFARIYEDHFHAVWLTLRRFGVWERELEDACHDVFLVAHRRLVDFDTTRPLRPWLKGIAANIASEFHRRAQHRREIASDDTERDSGNRPLHTPAMGVSADRALDDKMRRALVLLALDRLDFDRRTVLVMHDIDGHAMPDIAFSLSANVNTLYSRLRAARVDFKAALQLVSGGAL